MSRKLVAATAVVVTSMSMVLAGCGSSSSDSGKDSGSSSKTKKSDGSGKKKAGGLVTIVTNDPSNPYWETEGKKAKAEAKKLGYKTKVTASKGDVHKESNIVDTAIANKSAGLILDPADASGSVGNIKRAMKKKIPVFLVNAEINKTGVALGQLVSNNAQGASLAAQQWIKDTGSKGKYAELYGLPSDNNAQTRHNGFKSVLSQYKGKKRVSRQTADWDRAKGQKKTQSILQAHPNIDGILSGNDEMALGAIAALKQDKKLKDVKVGGFDGSPAAIKAIKDDALQYTVLQPVATFSKKAVDELNDYITKGKKPKQEKQSFDCILITKKNVNKMVGKFTYKGQD